jgi:hypothetical protein
LLKIGVDICLRLCECLGHTYDHGWCRGGIGFSGGPEHRLGFRTGVGYSLFDGAAYRAVIDAELFKKDTSVVEITFEGDAAVLAWLLPRRHNTSTDGMCLAVLGKEKSVLDVAGVVYSKTFLHHPTPISYTLLDASSKALLRYWAGLGLGLE